jgi:hypothetical protein
MQIRRAVWRRFKVLVVSWYPHGSQKGADMRVVPLLILFVCGLCVSVAPQARVADLATPAAADDAAGQAAYMALKAQADQALDLLRQARERRLAAAQFAAN